MLKLIKNDQIFRFLNLQILFISKINMNRNDEFSIQRHGIGHQFLEMVINHLRHIRHDSFFITEINFTIIYLHVKLSIVTIWMILILIFLYLIKEIYVIC